MMPDSTLPARSSRAPTIRHAAAVRPVRRGVCAAAESRIARAASFATPWSNARVGSRVVCRENRWTNDPPT